MNAWARGVLSLDADEELTEELQAEIRDMLEVDEETEPPVDGYRFGCAMCFSGDGCALAATTPT